MPEYIYLLENRLTPPQQHALKQVREAAREAAMTLFLVGGAVRDLTTGSSVRNLDFAIQGNALELEQAIAARGGELWGKHEETRSLTFWFPGSVRVSVASARTEQYPKPGKPVYQWSSIVEDLRRRDFTANSMGLSLNEGSYGLLLDPLNGVADIEARLLRLTSNYGFLEDPARLVRATRLQVRLGWQMDDKTAARYANAKEADAMQALSPYLRGYELEKIASEEDALQVLKALEAEGWMQHLLAAWTHAKADTAGLENLRRNWIQLLMQGVSADLTVAHLELLTARMDAAAIASLKQTMVHPGLVRHWEALEESAKEFGRQLTSKAATNPSASWKLFTTHPAEPILWLAHTRKTGAGAGAIDAKFKNFFTVWPEFRKKVPAALMLEMRITPELPGYAALLDDLFYQLIDGNLETDEQMRAFLEPYSPPAPPPPPTVRRSRAKKSESKTKRRTAAPDDEDEDSDDEDAPGVEDDDEEEDAADEIEEEPIDDPGLSADLGKLRFDADDPVSDDDPDDEAADEADPDGDADDSDAEPGPKAPAQKMKPGPGSDAGTRAAAPVSTPAQLSVEPASPLARKTSAAPAHVADPDPGTPVQEPRHSSPGGKTAKGAASPARESAALKSSPPKAAQAPPAVPAPVPPPAQKNALPQPAPTSAAKAARPSSEPAKKPDQVNQERAKAAPAKGIPSKAPAVRAEPAHAPLKAPAKAAAKAPANRPVAHPASSRAAAAKSVPDRTPAKVAAKVTAKLPAKVPAKAPAKKAAAQAKPSSGTTPAAKGKKAPPKPARKR